MPYVTDGRLLIERAFAGRYAMPAFNVCSLEMARACVKAAELERAPIILQTDPINLRQASPRVMAAMVRALADEAEAPVMLHLDHGDGLARVVSCLRAGYSSVMYDGEALPLEENVRETRRIAEAVHAAGMSLEAAAGSFGGGEGGAESVHLTEPEVAARLKEEGGADMVACSVGSRHGQPSRLDLERLAAVAEAVRGPLVLHGGSGIPAGDLARATELGVVKVNIGAALNRAVLKTWRAVAEGTAWHCDAHEAVREALTEVAREKIRLMKASDRV
jgi:fructose-bisphosphate aldolase, class II